MDDLRATTKLRRSKLAKLMRDGVALVFGRRSSEHPADRYRCSPNLYYLTGITESDCALALLAVDGELKEEILYCRNRDEAYERWHGELLGPLRAQRRLGIDETRPWRDAAGVFGDFVKAHPRLFVEFAAGGLPAAAQLAQSGTASVHNLQPLCAQLRSIKDAAELDKLRASARLAGTAFAAVLEQLPVARSEAQLAAALEQAYIAAGGTCAFPPIVAGGSNACVAHYHQNGARLRRGRLLLIDTGCDLAGYASDLSRTVPISGKFTDAQKDLYSIVLAAQRKALAKIKPGGSLAAAHKAARCELARGLIHLGILRGKLPAALKSSVLDRYYFHSVGHMVGLEVHDPVPQRQGFAALQKNMVVTIEPGLYLDDAQAVPKAIRNTGIRIEDTAAVTARGHEVLTAAAPKTLSQLRGALQA